MANITAGITLLSLKFRNGRKVENYKGARNMDDLADFVNTNKDQAGAAGEAPQDGKVPEQKEPETKVKPGWKLQQNNRCCRRS